MNDSYRKALGFSKPADAIGHTLTWQGKTLPIVGVVADFHTSSLHTAIPALVIVRDANRDNSVGLLGLTLFTVERKKKESGIRKVLGAGEIALIIASSVPPMPNLRSE